MDAGTKRVNTQFLYYRGEKKTKSVFSHPSPNQRQMTVSTCVSEVLVRLSTLPDTKQRQAETARGGSKGQQK